MRAATPACYLVATVVALASACGSPGPKPLEPGAGSGNAEPSQVQSLKRVTAVIRGSPFTLSHAINSAGAGSVPGVDELQELIHAGLGGEDDQRRIQPRLATSLPSVENGQWIVSPNGQMATTWQLRSGVHWQDGTLFTADDLLFTIRVAQDKRVALSGGSAYGAIERVSAPDPHTFVVTWSRPYIRADRLLTVTAGSDILPMPRHLLVADYEADATMFPQLSYWTHDFVGLGPFRLREFFEGSHLVLEANDGYLLGRPKIDEIEVKFIPDPSTIAANLLSNAVELTLGGRFSLEWGVQVRDQWEEGRMEAPPATSWVALYPQLLNPSPPALADLPFRQALLHAIDREEMADTIQAGLSPVAHAIVGRHDPEFGDVESSIVRYDHNVRAAAGLLEGLGYRKGGDGFYVDSANRRSSIEIRTRQGDDLQEKTLFGVSGYWQRLGIGVDPVTFPPQRAPDREYRSTRPAFEVVRQPSGPDAVMRYHGAETPLPENSFRGVNRTRYRSAQFDAMLDLYVSTIPRDERTRVLARIIHDMTSNLIVLGIYWAVDPTMIGHRLVNVSGTNPTWNAHQWDVNR